MLQHRARRPGDTRGRSLETIIGYRAVCPRRAASAREQEDVTNDTEACAPREKVLT